MGRRTDGTGNKRRGRHGCAVPQGDAARLSPGHPWRCPICRENWAANGLGGFRRLPNIEVAAG